MSSDLALKETSIPGLMEIKLVLHGDSRGWFKENYQAAKLQSLGLPKFEIVQNNFSFNCDVGVTRGLHAEPWEKFISLANGKVFAAWVDLRKGPSFGQAYTTEMSPDKAVFVPRGVANGYQTLEPNVTYTYLINDHWSPDIKYVGVNLFDPQIGINWLISKSKAIVSQKDANNPMLDKISPVEY